MLEFVKKPAKRTNIRFLLNGSIILYKGEPYMFDRIPNGASSIYVRHIETMKHLKIPITQDIDKMFFDVIGYCDFTKFNVQNNLSSLQKGDLFVIDNGGKGGLVFRFERNTDRNVIAINPINNKEVRILNNYIFTKIENLPF